MRARQCLAFGIVLALLVGVVGGCSPAAPPPEGRAATATASSAELSARRSIAQVGQSPTALPNRLAESASPYLRAAALQPVSWQPFDLQSLTLARTLGRPILLDVGGTWCHWCRVMASESYEDSSIAALINERFVAVKVDADERPDLDRRYQRTAQLIAGQAGWPLTLFLTPEGDAFAGGTYFPSRDDLGLPSFKAVLETMADSFRLQPEVLDQRGAAIANTSALLAEAGIVRGQLSSDLVTKIGQSILAAFDRDFGGIGANGKFPPTQAIDLALRLYGKTSDQRYLSFATRTLDVMAVSAIRDQLSGAFHRYSLDRSWNDPQFEIVGSLNGAIMLSYLRAYQITHDTRYRLVAEKIIDYLVQSMWDDSRAAFFSSVDADSAAGGTEGDYYTWTAEEVLAVLPADEGEAALLYYGLNVDRPGRAPLRVAMPVSEVARRLGLQPDEARSKLEAARQHLLVARDRRARPATDRSFYADRNFVLANDFLEAGRILERDDLRERALRTLALASGLTGDSVLLAHSYSFGRPVAPPMLDDQVAAATAMLGAFELTRDPTYQAQAGRLLDATIAVLADPKKEGFLDGTSLEDGGASPPRAPYDDGMILSGNPLAAIALDRYAALTGSDRHREQAASVLRAFAGAATEYGPFASSYALAVDHHLEGD